MNDDQRLVEPRRRVEAALQRWLPSPDVEPGRLHEAMRYAVLGGGKRIRPVLTYFAGQAVGVPAQMLDGPAVAVELIHAYSLVHDDLPAMDDDDLRRGRPTCHRAFDEATAVLAGDALQVLAFHVLATDPSMTADPAGRLEIIRLLADASGTGGMAGGQAIDLAAQGHPLSVPALETMHRLKTGALIHASIMMAAASAPRLGHVTRDALDAYGRAIGLAFQIQDDILDVEGDTALLGKQAGADEARHKPTYPSIGGMAAAKARLGQLHAEAMTALEPLGEAGRHLAWLSGWLTARRH